MLISRVFLLLATFCSFNSLALEMTQIHQEIDKSIWHPFKQAFESQDGQALNDLYAEEVLRVTPEGVDTDSTFKTLNLERFAANKERGDSIELNFWLDKRQSTDSVSYNVGFYRIGITSRSGKTDFFYGQFHIVLQKSNGRWRIAQDWDTDTIAGDHITAEQFNQQAIQF